MGIKENKKMAAIAGVLATSALMMGSASAALDASAFTTVITSSIADLEGVLTAGLGIVGAFFIWKILKRGLNKAA